MNFLDCKFDPKDPEVIKKISSNRVGYFLIRLKRNKPILINNNLKHEIFYALLDIDYYNSNKLVGIVNNMALENIGNVTITGYANLNLIKTFEKIENIA